MQGTIDAARMDRRAVLVGGAALASGGLFLATPQAEASPAKGAWIGGVVEALPSNGSIRVRELPLETGRVFRVHGGLDTIIRTNLAPGSTILVDGAPTYDGAVISARQVIPAVFGSRSDAKQ